MVLPNLKGTGYDGGEEGGLPGLPPRGDEETSEQSQCDLSEV